MAIQDAQYEVDWQIAGEEPGDATFTTEDRLGPDEPSLDQVSPDGPGEGTLARLGLVARFAALVANADTAAVVVPGRRGLTVEAVPRSESRLSPGSVLPAHPCLGMGRAGAISQLLSGSLSWCRCLPPPGFASGALLAATALARSERLVLVANSERMLAEQDLWTATSYLTRWDG